MARHHLCRYCNRYDRACGRPHTEETRADWGRTWDGHPAPKHPTPMTTSRGETMTEPRDYLTLKSDYQLGHLSDLLDELAVPAWEINDPEIDAAVARFRERLLAEQRRRVAEGYTAEQAHADGRHASRHPEDRAYWRQVCGECDEEARA